MGFQTKNSRFPSMFRSSKGSVLTWQPAEVTCTHGDLRAYACPPQPPLTPSGSSSSILYFSTPLGMPHPNPFFFPFLPFSFLFSEKKNIISFLAFFFLALLCPRHHPPHRVLLLHHLSSVHLNPLATLSMRVASYRLPPFSICFGSITLSNASYITSCKLNEYKPFSFTALPWEAEDHQPNLPYLFSLESDQLSWLSWSHALRVIRLP